MLLYDICHGKSKMKMFPEQEKIVFLSFCSRLVFSDPVPQLSFSALKVRLCYHYSGANSRIIPTDENGIFHFEPLIKISFISRL